MGGFADGDAVQVDVGSTDFISNMSPVTPLYSLHAVQTCQPGCLDQVSYAASPERHAHTQRSMQSRYLFN